MTMTMTMKMTMTPMDDENEMLMGECTKKLELWRMRKI
jgi:hypothetical protein